MNLKISKTNVIKTVEQWRQFAPPKDEKKQWKEGKSALSLAQFITDKRQVKQLEKVLKDLGYDTRGEILCTPEANTILPGKGGGRNHDLLMIGKDFVAGIEAKVAESFDGTIRQEYKNASSNKQYRIDKLVSELFQCEINEDIKDLRYQLLTGAVGTLFEAIRNRKNKALFLVIVFVDGITNAERSNVKKNNDDYDAFCKSLGLGKGGAKTVFNIELTIKKIEISLNNDHPSSL